MLTILKYFLKLLTIFYDPVRDTRRERKARAQYLDKLKRMRDEAMDKNDSAAVTRLNAVIIKLSKK